MSNNIDAIIIDLRLGSRAIFQSYYEDYRAPTCRAVTASRNRIDVTASLTMTIKFRNDQRTD